MTHGVWNEEAARSMISRASESAYVTMWGTNSRKLWYFKRECIYKVYFKSDYSCVTHYLHIRNLLLLINGFLPYYCLGNPGGLKTHT